MVCCMHLIMSSFTTQLGDEYREVIEKILKIRPEWRNKKKVCEVALDKLLENLVMFSAEERKVIEAHARLAKEYEDAKRRHAEKSQGSRVSSSTKDKEK